MIELIDITLVKDVIVTIDIVVHMIDTRHMMKMINVVVIIEMTEKRESRSNTRYRSKRAK